MSRGEKVVCSGLQIVSFDDDMSGFVCFLIIKESLTSGAATVIFGFIIFLEGRHSWLIKRWYSSVLYMGC
jgi:hypothetical protein